MSGKKDDDGTALWEAVKASARPVRRESVRRPISAKIVTAKAAEKPAKAKNAAAASLPAAVPPPKPPKKGDLRHGCAPGVDKRTAKRLRKGKMTIDRRLDLHGMSRKDAHRVVIGMVTAAHGAGQRCVLIVTGKGKGILQSELPRWLNLPPLRDKILSFSYAQQQDGGQGAVYVLIRRN